MLHLMTGILDHIFKTYLTSFNPIRTSGVEFDPFKDIPVFPPLHGFIFAFMKLQCRKGCTAVIANYFNTDQVLEMVLADGSDLEDEESVDDFGELESEIVLFVRKEFFWKVRFDLCRHVTGLHC